MKKILSFSFILILSQVFFAQNSRPENTRMFEPTVGNSYPGFVKHSNEDSSETFFQSFGAPGRQYLKKFKSDGTLKWQAQIDNSTFSDLSLTRHNISIDNNDALIFNVVPPIGAAICNFIDSEGVVENLATDRTSILKVDKNGKLVFKKYLNLITNENLRTSVYTDSANNIYVIGNNDSPVDSFYIIKYDGLTGEQLFLKNYENVGVYNAFLIFDSADNFHVFLDCFTTEASLNFDSVTIPRGSDTTNVIVKFDKNGNALLGKNFNNNGQSSSFTFLSDGSFDGTNLIVAGCLVGSRTGSFTGLDNLDIPRKYPNTSYQGLMAKIDLQGNVIWQKPIFSSVDLNQGMLTNLSVDSEKNFYGYFQFKDKINYDNTQFQFDAVDGNSVVSKFNSNGENLYFNSVTSGKVLNSFTTKTMDLISEDVYNINGTTMENKFLEYPLINQNYSKSYIATFGNLSKKYLTPENNYLELTTANIPNNPAPTVNEFSFTLVNNVNWTATSDQSWLNLSSISLTSKSPQQTIIGNGDAKITLTADQNTTGVSRSSNVIISGEGVPSKTVIVSQTATLGINNNALSIITMYPNPTSDFLNIKSDQKISKIEIYDMSGKLVQTSKMNNEKVSVSKLPKGNYLIKLQTENGVVNSKFIKN